MRALFLPFFLSVRLSVRPSVFLSLSLSVSHSVLQNKLTQVQLPTGFHWEVKKRHWETFDNRCQVQQN